MLDTIANLETLRRQFKVQYQGHRSQILALTCRGFKAALEIKKSPKRRKAFFLVANIPSKERERLNIVTEVLVYAMSGEKSEKSASWRGRELVPFSTCTIAGSR
jgi:hypothetical protein